MSWGVIPPVQYPFQPQTANGSMSDMSKIQKLNTPDDADKARAKDEEQSMLPEQGYWYNSTMNSIASMKSNVQSEITDWFMKNPRKAPDVETQKMWNEKLAKVEDVRLRVKSQEGRFKQNFKDVSKIMELDASSPNSSLGRIMTDNNGVPVVGEKANGNTGFMNYAEALSQVDRIPGINGRGDAGTVPYVETRFSGTFDNAVTTALKDAVKSKHILGQSSSEQVGKDATYMNTITTSGNPNEVWNAAGQIMNNLGPKEWSDLRSDFWENIFRSGGKRTDGSFGFDQTIPLFDPRTGQGTVARRTYSFSPSKDYDKIAIIDKILNGGKPENVREENTVKDMITEYGIHRIINQVPTFIDQEFTQDKFKSSDTGNGPPLEPWAYMVSNGPTNTSTLSKLATDQEPDAFNNMKKYETVWDNTVRTLGQNKDFQSIKPMKGESDVSVKQRQEVFINTIRNDIGKKILGPDYENIIKNSGTLITLKKYVISPDMSEKSGFNMLPLEGQKYWPIGAKDPVLFEPGKFKHQPFVLEATMNFKGDKLFGPQNENLTQVTAVVHKDDLGQIMFTKTDGGKPKLISYKDLLDDYPDIAAQLIHKIDDKSIDFGSKFNKVSGDPYLKKQVPSLQEMVSDGHWFTVKTYLTNDEIISQAAMEANKTENRSVSGNNVALNSVRVAGGGQ